MRSHTLTWKFSGDKLAQALAAASTLLSPRPEMANLYPLRERSFAVSKPIPVLPPATSATFGDIVSTLIAVANAPLADSFRLRLRLDTLAELNAGERVARTTAIEQLFAI